MWNLKRVGGALIALSMVFGVRGVEAVNNCDSKACDFFCTTGVACEPVSTDCDTGAPDDFCVICGVDVDGPLGADIITGVAGKKNVICGFRGDDDITGADQDDIILGGDGDDILDDGDGAGDFGTDSLDGGGGDDVLRGHEGNDLLEGKGGADDLYDDAGSNTLVGGSGKDTLETNDSLPHSEDPATFGSNLCGGRDKDVLIGGGFGMQCMDPEGGQGVSGPPDCICNEPGTAAERDIHDACIGSAKCREPDPEVGDATGCGC